MYVYIQSEKSQPPEGKFPATNGLWTVGFYDPQGKFQPESDHPKPEEAAARVNYLNGNNKRN